MNFIISLRFLALVVAFESTGNELCSCNSNVSILLSPLPMFSCQPDSAFTFSSSLVQKNGMLLKEVPVNDVFNYLLRFGRQSKSTTRGSPLLQSQCTEIVYWHVESTSVRGSHSLSHTTWHVGSKGSTFLVSYYKIDSLFPLVRQRDTLNILDQTTLIFIFITTWCITLEP
jgi:hypothetical protein